MPMRPAAPPRLSTTNCWPRASESFCENWRAEMSLPPPGANGTMTRTGLVGYCWACAGAAAVSTAASASTVYFMFPPSFLGSSDFVMLTPGVYGAEPRHERGRHGIKAPRDVILAQIIQGRTRMAQAVS